jgi:hypothetical protein
MVDQVVPAIWRNLPRRDRVIKSQLDRVVRGSVEETLNALLDAEADQLCNAQPYRHGDASARVVVRVHVAFRLNMARAQSASHAHKSRKEPTEPRTGLRSQ